MHDTISPEKGRIAKFLAEGHLRVEPARSQIIRVISDREQDPSEPVKLLEVNPDTSPSGIVPIAFGPDPPTVPFPLVLIEVTPGEYEQLQDGDLKLPYGWQLAEALYRSAA